MTKTAVIADIRARYEGCKGQFDRITNNAWRLHADIGILLAMCEYPPAEPRGAAESKPLISLRPAGEELLRWMPDGSVFCKWPDGRFVEVVEKSSAEPSGELEGDASRVVVIEGEMPDLADFTGEPNHPCAHKGCTALISSRVKYCKDHEPTSALQARFTCEGKYCHRSFVIKYQPGAKIMGASCVCGHYTEFKEPALRTTGDV